MSDTKLVLPRPDKRGYPDYRTVYSDPETFGLRIVDELEYTDASYEFDTRVVWCDAEGRLWTARDSGCSCPSPFEDTFELDRVFNLDDLEAEFRAALRDKFASHPSLEEWESFRDNVKTALDALRAKS